MKSLKLLLTMVILVLCTGLFSQVYYENTTANEENFSSAIGKSTVATGVGAFASGGFSSAEGNFSTSIGFRNLSSIYYTTTIGNYLKATSSHAMVIGDGYGINYELINSNAYSLMIGFNSTKPTIFVGTSPGYQQTGRIAIGNTTSPLQKLHLKADEEEIAAILIEPFNWSGSSNGGNISKNDKGSTNLNGAYLMLGNENHGIEAINNVGLIFNSESDYLFGEGRVGIGVESPKTKLHINGDLLFENNMDGIIMKSPDGKCWKGNINNNGELTFTNVDCDNLSDIDNKEVKSQVFIYPNPASNQIIVEYTGNQENIRLKLKTINNTLISTHKIFQGENTIIINDIPSQMIIATIFDTNGNIISSEKVIIIE